MEQVNTNFFGFNLIAQEKLQAIICSIPGKKHLVLESFLIKPLEHVCSASWLRLKGIQRIFKFEAENLIQSSADEALVFMISSRLELFNTILKYIESLEKQSPNYTDELSIKKYHVICVPNCYAYFSTLLEAEGLYGKVQLHRFNWDFIMVDEGILSMEIPLVFPTVFLKRDTSILSAVAQSLRIMQVLSGIPNLTITFGTQSSNIVKMMKTLGNIPNSKQPAPKLDLLLIIDRDKDYVSSLLTPSIYAGLLLEVFDFHAGEIIVENDNNKIIRQKLKLFQLPKADSNKTPKNLKIKLNSKNDEIYAENRYKHFTQVSSIIRSQAKSISIETQKLNDMKLEEMHEYVARKLPKITELKTKISRHLNASEKIIEELANNFLRIRALEENILNNVSRKRALAEIDELLTIDGQKFNTLRLLCLFHLSAGLDNDELSLFIQNYCNYFGHKYLEVFQLLAMAGLLPELQAEKPKKAVAASKLLSNLPIPKFQQTEFQANCNRLRLMDSSIATDDTDSRSQASNASSTSNEIVTSPSYVFNGLYIPVVAQICSMITKFTNSEEFSTKFGMLDMELHVENVQTTFTPKSYSNSVRQNEIKELFPLQNTPSIVVMIIGGVTYAEIAACNIVERITGAKITIASDSIISGCDLIESAFR